MWSVDRPTDRQFEGTVELTKIPFKFELTFTKSDVILIATTGGAGWLVKEAYKYFSSQRLADIKTQSDNLQRLLRDAERSKSQELFVTVHPDVPIMLPKGGNVEELDRTTSRVRYRFYFSWPESQIIT